MFFFSNSWGVFTVDLYIILFRFPLFFHQFLRFLPSSFVERVAGVVDFEPIVIFQIGVSSDVRGGVFEFERMLQPGCFNQKWYSRHNNQFVISSRVRSGWYQDSLSASPAASSDGFSEAVGGCLLFTPSSFCWNFLRRANVSSSLLLAAISNINSKIH